MELKLEIRPQKEGSECSSVETVHHPGILDLEPELLSGYIRKN